jgi:hypothetical protein
MTPRISALLGCLALLLGLGGSAQAAPITTYDFGGALDPSLHGASGSLSVEDLGGGNYKVIWEINTAGFTDAAAISTGHRYLTDVAFKISGVTGVSLVDGSLGTLYYESNINSASDGCVTGGSPAGFACVVLDPDIDATVDQIFSVEFMVTGNLDLGSSVAYRGKFGESEGWVISESSGGPKIPEPSAALVFGVGALVVGSRSRRR